MPLDDVGDLRASQVEEIWAKVQTWEAFGHHAGLSSDGRAGPALPTAAASAELRYVIKHPY